MGRHKKVHAVEPASGVGKNEHNLPDEESACEPVGVFIQCVSTRGNHIDRKYGTGEWDEGQIKDVPALIAAKMLAHKDVYALPDGPVTGEVDVVVEDLTEAEQESKDADTLDAIALMSKDQAKDFIELNFNRRLDMRNFPTEDAIRGHAKMLFNQFGLPR